MPRQRHYYGLNHLHFITASTYRRARLFDSDRFRRHFIATLDALRRELEFKVVGYVLMPEHFHLLLWPSPSLLFPLGRLHIPPRPAPLIAHMPKIGMYASPSANSETRGRRHTNQCLRHPRIVVQKRLEQLAS